MTEIKIHIDARPEVWSDAIEFLDAPERGRSPRSKIIGGKEHDPDELIPEGMRADLHHKDWGHIQDRTSPGKLYTAHWVHGQFVEASHSGAKRLHSHYESWFLVVDDGGHFLDIPAKICSPE